jgi:hypothetical protein
MLPLVGNDLNVASRRALVRHNPSTSASPQWRHVGAFLSNQYMNALLSRSYSSLHTNPT